MKLKTLSLLTLVFALCLTSCKSKEEKAAELIKTELSKTLYDFESYEPIETTVTEAYQTAYNDSTCFNKAGAIAYGMKKASEYAEETKDAIEHAEIWGAPDYYSSSYSDRQYYKYQKEAEENRSKALNAYNIVKEMGIALQDSIKNLDPKKVIGWEVHHRFRCKTKGGLSTIGDYRYIISTDFKSIILSEDTDNLDFKNVRDAIEMAINNEFNDL